MTNSYLALVLLIVFTSSSVFAMGGGSEDPILLTNCKTIDSPGTYYLMNDIVASGDCFLIDSSQVIFNGNGYTIHGPTNLDEVYYGILVHNRHDIQIANVSVRSFYTPIVIRTYSYAVTLSGVRIYDSVEGLNLFNVRTVGVRDSIFENNQRSGISALFTFDSVFENLTIQDNGLHGMLLFNGGGNRVESARIHSNAMDGISVSESSPLVLSNITVTFNGGRGFSFEGVSTNLSSFYFANNTLGGIFVSRPDRNVFRDGILLDQPSLNVSFSPFVVSSLPLTLINVSYFSGSEQFNLQSGGILKKWYYDETVYFRRFNLQGIVVTPIEGASVSASNQVGSVLFNVTSNHQGVIPQQELVEFFMNRSGVTYYNYTIRTEAVVDNRTGYIQFNRIAQVSNNLHQIVTFQFLRSPKAIREVAVTPINRSDRW